MLKLANSWVSATHTSALQGVLVSPKCCVALYHSFHTIKRIDFLLCLKAGLFLLAISAGLKKNVLTLPENLLWSLTSNVNYARDCLDEPFKCKSFGKTYVPNLFK